LSSHALAWPATLGPVANRLGYTTSAGVYLPANAASGVTISITAGTANVYAGAPNAGSHRLLVGLAAGQSYQVTGLATDEVVSVQNDLADFAYTLTAPVATPTAQPTATALPPTATPTAACADPLACNPVESVKAFWRCNIAGCTDADWLGTVITWPSWSAYDTNARAGSQSRTVYSEQGERLYPYMGAWANGCQVTAVSGTVLIIEWQRGTDMWRETSLSPGQTYTIALAANEDGAMIETPATEPIAVSLANCNPQNIATASETTLQTEAGSPMPADVPAINTTGQGMAEGGRASLGLRLYLPLIRP
jgi:hypothetical protein